MHVLPKMTALSVLMAVLPVQAADLIKAWTSSTVYTGGQQAHYQNQIYKAKWWTQNNLPTAANSPWTLVGACDSRCDTGGGTGGGSGGTTPPKTGPQPKPGGGYTLLQSEVDATEAQLTASPLFALTRANIATRANSEVEAIVPGRSSNPDNVRRVERLLPASQWAQHFGMANPAYSYGKFLQAVGKFSGFCRDFTDGRDPDAICRKALATMFAHFTQETGAHDRNSSIEEWRQGLYFVKEAGCSDNDTSCGYNSECSMAGWQTEIWPCGKDAQGRFKKYYGRGAKQLSYHYNYGPFSQAMYGDAKVLLNNPELVADTWLNLASAVFFMMYPASPKPSMWSVLDGSWVPNSSDASRGISPGFGATTNIINGGIECGHGYEKPQSLNRMAYYQRHAAQLGVPITAAEQLGCKDQKPFDVSGAGALNIYWEMDWAYYPNNPEGKAFACKLVGYQTAYSALQKGDYAKCVQKYFNVELVK